MLIAKEVRGLCIFVFGIFSGYSVNAFFTSTKFRRKLEFDVNGFTAGDVIQTRDTDTMGCLMLCLRIESCISALSLQGSCTMLNIRLCTGSRQDNDKQYYMKEDGYIYSDTLGLFYKVFYEPTLRQDDAQVFCQTECGTLLRIDTEEKLKYVQEQMEIYDYGSDAFYIDGEKSGGTWYWADGSVITTFFWAPGQPNYAPAKIIRMVLEKDRMWDDGSGSSKKAFICQMSFK